MEGGNTPDQAPKAWVSHLAQCGGTLELFFWALGLNPVFFGFLKNPNGFFTTPPWFFFGFFDFFDVEKMNGKFSKIQGKNFSAPPSAADGRARLNLELRPK